MSTKSSGIPELKASYKHYATYIFITYKSRGIVKIENFDPASGNATVAIIWGEPDPAETQEKVTNIMNSGELLTFEEVYPEKNSKQKKKYNMVVE